VIQSIWATFIFLYLIPFRDHWNNVLAQNGYLLLVPSSGLYVRIFVFSKLASKRPESIKGNYKPLKASNIKLFKAAFCYQIKGFNDLG
jgi:hypothetical protein